MSTDLITLDGDADLRDSLQSFRTHAYRRLPAVDKLQLQAIGSSLGLTASARRGS